MGKTIISYKTALFGLAVVAFGAAVWHFGTSRPAKKPHVVLMIIDTLRADRLSCYGYPLGTSPEIDRYASEGVRFANAISQTSWTRPSVGSMLTSLHPRSIGIYEEESEILNDRFTTLAEILQQNGYRTLGATANPHLNKSFNFHQGFDYYLDSLKVWRWMESQPRLISSSRQDMASAMDLFTDVLRMLDLEKGRHRQAPHYLQFNIMEVHQTWGENSLIREKYGRLFGAPERNRKERYYLQAIRQVSHDIDWFITRLTRRPGWENTLVVLVSDHGEGMNSHPDVPHSVSHGHLLYQSQVSVPWILYSTAGVVPAGVVVEHPVRLLDLMPTVLELCGINATYPMRGKSVVPLFDNQVVQLPKAFVVETEFRESEKLGVYTENWKYFENRDGHRGLNQRELQRFGSTENGKETDLADLHPEVVERLSTYLENWERENPKITPTLADRELSPEEVRQLRALGYIQ